MVLHDRQNILSIPTHFVGGITYKQLDAEQKYILEG